MFMTELELIQYIEDRPFKPQEEWFYHATDRDLDMIENIFKEGIKCAFLRKEKSNQGYNGKYYVSVSKKSDDPNCVFNLFSHLPILVLDGIKPIKADPKNFLFGSFMETILPFRTSSKEDEYQQFLKINPDKIIALGFSIAHMLENNYKFDMYRLLYLKKIICMLQSIEKSIPVYDFTSNMEINKDKVLSLDILKDL